MSTSAAFGADEPFAEPYWYAEGAFSPYYNASHVAFRAKVRSFVDAHVRPHVRKWEASEELPVATLFPAAARAGVYAPQWPVELGGTPPEGAEQGFDAFHDFIWVDEISRAASQSVVLGFTIYTMGLPPVLSLGTPEMVREVVPRVLRGEAMISCAANAHRQPLPAAPWRGRAELAAAAAVRTGAWVVWPW
jgi:alkylation response protein AidB-like acyl-CoA dehydrogenase